MQSKRYAELLCKSNYSFLRGASHPAELIGQAAKLDLDALALTDVGGVYGIPKAYLAQKENPQIKLICGAEIPLEDKTSLTLLAQNRAAYGLLCRILTEAHRDRPKADPLLSHDKLRHFLGESSVSGLIAIPRMCSLTVSIIDERSTATACRSIINERSTAMACRSIDYSFYKEVFGERVVIPLFRVFDGKDEDRTTRALELRRRFGISILASNDVHYHVRQRSKLQDVMVSIREGVRCRSAGFKLFMNSERYLKSPEQMSLLFRDLPEAIHKTVELAEQCSFSPSELRYRYPSEWIPQGHTAQSYLEQEVFRGAQERYQGMIPENVQAQLKHELSLIEQLQFADYFLTVYEIVAWARSRDILCQGRGSAANSIVCYCLKITAIDPVRMNLLFERFISVERGEPPDIDVDFEHERREEVIQHVYEKYGRDRAAMVSAVITYRRRSALREVSKVLSGEFEASSTAAVADAPSIALSMSAEIEGFPRHLSIHSGGFTLSADPITEIVPVEPATMEGRTIIQWDKYDLDALGLLKIDLLSLGMLTATKKCLDLLGKDLSDIPPDDPKTYSMIQKADTVGVFQIESRAQMSMLPRLKPQNFYDLVIEVALVRPGPIVGGMVHPYLRRRQGQEPCVFPDPRLKPILERTLGVPIFQEQVMKIATALADFTPGESDQLRRAIGAWRSSGSIDQMGQRLMQGLLKNGIPKSFADQIFKQIHGFAEYGFPESHAASFALIAYATAYLKCHHPAEFVCSLINSQPLGFYSNHTLVDDAKRHGVQVLPIHPNLSEWDCKMESVNAVRLGFRVVSGMNRREVEYLIAQRAQSDFKNLADFLDRSRLRKNMMRTLALGDAFSCFGIDQRHALWFLFEQEVLCSRNIEQLELFSNLESNLKRGSVFKEMNEYQEIQADYESYRLSVRGHPMQAIRKQVSRLPRWTTAKAKQQNGKIVEVAGLAIVMQRPPTAKGTVFATLEDEEGFLDLILWKDVFEKYRDLVLEHGFLIVRGVIQAEHSMLVQKIRKFPLPQLMAVDRLLSEGVLLG